ncbi:MAG: hypothetical protein P9L94_13075 [Candidatus Hinthialibacter antarcticus]|nr:hypothetical protein [Candidatus Hinthialibacter antarcticus]
MKTSKLCIGIIVISSILILSFAIKQVWAACSSISFGNTKYFYFDVVASPHCLTYGITQNDLKTAIENADYYIQSPQPEITNPDWDKTASVHFYLSDFIAPTSQEMIDYNLTEYVDLYSEFVNWMHYTCLKTDYVRLFMVYDTTVYPGASTLGQSLQRLKDTYPLCECYCFDGLPWPILYDGEFFLSHNSYQRSIVIAHEFQHTLVIGDAYYDCPQNIMSADIWSGFHGSRVLQVQRMHDSNAMCPTCYKRVTDQLPNVHCDYYDGL